jgi:hypothetical protein
MVKRKATGLQLSTLPLAPPELEQISFNLDKQDQFVKSHGPTWQHFAAIPSPRGLKDRGDIRRGDSVDTLESNGMLYRCMGTFDAVLLSNSASHSDIEGGQMGHATGRVTMPRYYNDEKGNKKEIHIAPGDRLYIKDLEVKISNYQLMEYTPKAASDFLQFPALCVEFLVDSQGREYTQGKEFTLDSQGNIVWIVGQGNPGIDIDTGKGRVYSVRYLYNAHWYVTSILNEVRVGKVTVGDTREVARMPYQIMVAREYIYHNRAKPAADDINVNKQDNRTNSEPKETLDPNKSKFKVQTNSFE